MSIETVQDWWATVDRYKQQLLDILHMYLPMRDPAHEDPGNADSPLLLRGIATVSGERDFLQSIDARDWQRVRKYLFGAWSMSPDDISIHKNAGWGQLCDLLSEDWVFDVLSNTLLVTCVFCHAETPEALCQYHRGGPVCSECWDERLRTTS